MDTRRFKVLLPGSGSWNPEFLIQPFQLYQCAKTISQPPSGVKLERALVVMQVRVVRFNLAVVIPSNIGFRARMRRASR